MNCLEIIGPSPVQLGQDLPVKKKGAHRCSLHISDNTVILPCENDGAVCLFLDSAAYPLTMEEGVLMHGVQQPLECDIVGLNGLVKLRLDEGLFYVTGDVQKILSVLRRLPPALSVPAAS